MNISLLRRIHHFRFSKPQGIAALMLAFFLAQGIWWLERNPFDLHEKKVECGRALWSHPFTAPNHLAACGVLYQGPLVYRVAALASNSRCGFLIVGLLLGGAIWWVTRRQFGNLGGYTALALYCTSPLTIRYSTWTSADILTDLAVYAGVYTMTGVAHAMQGPRRKWKPRILLLAMILAAAACTSLVALTATLVLGLALMLWIAEENRRWILPVVGIALALGAVGALIGSNFSPASLFVQSTTSIRLTVVNLLDLFRLRENMGLALVLLAALALFAGSKRSRYFGHTAPLLCALVLLSLDIQSSAIDCSPELWALPFLFTFVGGVFADGYESRFSFFWKVAIAAWIPLQAVACFYTLIHSGLSPM